MQLKRLTNMETDDQNLLNICIQEAFIDEVYHSMHYLFITMYIIPHSKQDFEAGVWI